MGGGGQNQSGANWNNSQNSSVGSMTPYMNMFSGIANNYGNPYSQMAPMAYGAMMPRQNFLQSPFQQPNYNSQPPVPTDTTMLNQGQINQAAGLPVAGQAVAQPTMPAPTIPTTGPAQNGGAGGQTGGAGQQANNQNAQSSQPGFYHPSQYAAGKYSWNGSVWVPNA